MDVRDRAASEAAAASVVSKEQLEIDKGKNKKVKDKVNANHYKIALFELTNHNPASGITLQISVLWLVKSNFAKDFENFSKNFEFRKSPKFRKFWALLPTSFSEPEPEPFLDVFQRAPKRLPARTDEKPKVMPVHSPYLISTTR